MDVHHINYDKNTCCNEKRKLFVTLCRSCHSKTNANRKYWENILTKIIDEQYNGQCYCSDDEYFKEKYK